jgi:hypothetical protein
MVHQPDMVAAEVNGTRGAMNPEDEGKAEASGSELYIDPAKEKLLLAKLDMFICPIIMLVYLCCFLDRSNIGM